MLLFNVIPDEKPEVLPHITHLAKLPLTACDQERYLEARKDSHAVMCTRFSFLYVHLACLLYVLFSKMSSPLCGQLMWLSRRFHAAFVVGCTIQC